MPHTTTVEEIKNFFGHIEKIQTIQDTEERNKTIESVFGESLANDPAKLESLYILFSQKPEDNHYQQLLIYATFRVLLEQNGLPTEQATKLYTLFNEDINKIKKYLQDYTKQNLDSPEPMHDACNFAIPAPNSEYSSKIWTDLSAKYLTELPFRELLAQVPEIEELIKAQAQMVPHTNKPTKKTIFDLTKEIETLNSSIKKRRARASTLTDEQTAILQQDADALIQKKADLTAIGLPFNNEMSLTALSAFREKYILKSSQSYKQFLANGLTKKDHEKFKKLKRYDDNNIIPPLIIDGTTIGYPGYYLMKVPVMEEAHAARAAYFGKLTNCCQSLSGEAGESCVIHGLTSPNGGFYVICQGDVEHPQVTDEVLGQSWVWRGKENALVFDSIEISRKNTGIYENTEKIVTDLIHEAATQLFEKHNVEQVLCGANSGISTKVATVKNINLEQFRDYQGYSDARTQHVLKNKQGPFYFLEGNQKNTQVTIQWIKEKLKNITPLAAPDSLWKALNWAIVSENTSLLKIIEKLASEIEIDRLSEIHYLIKNLEEYIENGVGPDIIASIEANTFPLEAYNTDGQTPLMDAALYGAISGETESMMTLVQQGAKLEHIDKYGKTALMVSIRNIKAVIPLINAGANLDHADKQGQTALMYAITFKNKEVPLALIEAGANLEHIDQNSQTPLLLAILEKNTEIALNLIQRGVNLERVDKHGRTALLLATQNQNIHIVLALIQAGAKLECADNDGNTPLLHAIRNKSKKIALSLIQAGASLEHRNHRGKTALMEAQQFQEITSAIKERLEAHGPVLTLTTQESKNMPETKTERPEPPEPEITIRHRRPSR